MTSPHRTAARISVVVCSLNGGRKLPACLNALAEQTVPHAETVVVDDGSTDNTASVAERYDVKLIRHHTNLGLATARNTGVAAATSPLVAFTDDDCIPDPTWLELLLKQMDDDDGQTVKALGGCVEPASVDTFARRYIESDNPLRPLALGTAARTLPHRRLLSHLRAQLTTHADPGGTRPVHSLVGANMAFRKAVLDDIGGFDDRITFGGEEEDVCRRINESHGAGSVVFSPAIRVRHEYEATVRDVLRRRRAYGRGNARTHLKAGRRVPPVPPGAAVVVAVGAWALFDRRRGAAWMALPFAFYLAGARRSTPDATDTLAFAGMKFLEEVTTFAGFVEGWFRFRREYR